MTSTFITGYFLFSSLTRSVKLALRPKKESKDLITVSSKFGTMMNRPCLVLEQRQNWQAGTLTLKQRKNCGKVRMLSDKLGR